MITIKYFGSLKEQVGKTSEHIPFTGVKTVQDVWLTVQPDGLRKGVLMAVNQSYAHVDDAVADGDEVAFFPPVTGG